MEPEVVSASTAAADPQGGGSKKKRTIWIASGVAAALALGGVIATPLIVQSIRDRERAELSAEIASTYGSLDDASAQLEAASALSSLQYAESQTFVKDLGSLGKTAEPILSNAQAQSLSEAAAAATKALGDGPEKSDERAAAVKLVQAKVDELKQADKTAAAKAKKAKKDAPAATAPASFLALSADDVQALIGEESGAARVEPDVRATKKGDELDAAREELEAAQSALQQVRTEVDAERELSSTYTEAIAGTLSPLVKVSEGAPAQAKSVVAAASKAGDSGKAVTAAADASKQAAGEQAATATQVRAKLAAYVDAAKTAQKAHADQVAAEEAAAAGGEVSGGEVSGGEPAGGGETGGGWNGGGYDNGSGGGGWNPGTGDGGAGGGGGWNPGAGDGGAGGGTGGGGTGGGGGAGGGSGGGTGGGSGGSGGGGPATSCPPGTYPTGSWDNINGVHCLPNGTDEGW